MANPVCEVLLTDAPLTAPAEQPERETGAVVDFWGVVRATENGAEIAGIDYEAHRAMAEHQLHALARDAAEQFPLKSVSIRHRIGFVAAGEPSLLLRVCSGHRAEAFAAAQWIVDRLKKRVPIWKHPRHQVITVARSGTNAEPAESVSVAAG
jgi:molybdopterin synthase catalytic subunit